MEELVNVLQSKTGLSEAKAKQAVEVVVSFIKDKLPSPLATQVDAALKNEALADQAADLLDEGAKGLGGLLGKK